MDSFSSFNQKCAKENLLIPNAFSILRLSYSHTRLTAWMPALFNNKRTGELSRRVAKKTSIPGERMRLVFMYKLKL